MLVLQSQYILSKSTESDIINIYNYSCAEFGKSSAYKYISRLANMINFIAENPKITARKYTDKEHNHYFIRSVAKHNIYYQIVTEDTVLIVRILNQRMAPDHHISG